MKQSLKKQGKYIAILGPMGLPIPPEKQGGIEWMVYYLAEGLVKQGWPVLLFAPKGSKTKAKLIETAKNPISKQIIPEGAEVSRRLRVELSALVNLKYEILKRKNKIAVIFNHTVNGGLFADLEKLSGIPTYHVLHLPLFPQIAKVYQKSRTRLISISNNQRKSFPGLNYKATIYNGIDLKKFPFIDKPKNQFLFAGKIRRGKNPLTAIEAAKALKAKLILAGKINNQEYFEKEIKKHLSSKIVYKGEVPFREMVTLYGQSRALLFPIKWPEPFGLVMIESMACGSPVIAFDQGSVREVVKQGKTGFIVKDIKNMVKAMQKIDQIKRIDCREHISKNFSVEKMVEEYEKIIKKHAAKTLY